MKWIVCKFLDFMMIHSAQGQRLIFTNTLHGWELLCRVDPPNCTWEREPSPTELQWLERRADYVNGHMSIVYKTLCTQKDLEVMERYIVYCLEVMFLYF